MVGRPLELDRADEAPAGPGRQPTLDERQQPRRIAHDIAEQPIHGPDRSRVKREGALTPVLDAGHPRDRGVERRLVNTDNARAHLRQSPAPPAGAAAEIEAEIAGAGTLTD